MMAVETGAAAAAWRRILEEHVDTVQRLTLLMGRNRTSRTLCCQLFKTCLQSILISYWEKYVCSG
jgi:hypothetical protein